METKLLLLKSLAGAASAILVFSDCDKQAKESASDRSGDSLSQGTGYGGQGAGMGGAQDRTGTASERDTDFEKSFYGPPGWDWRFTPGNSIYDFEKKGIGGTGSDTSNKDNTTTPKD